MLPHEELEYVNNTAINKPPASAANPAIKPPKPNKATAGPKEVTAGPKEVIDINKTPAQAAA